MDTQIRKALKTVANIGCALVMLLLPLSAARGDAVSDWHAIAVRVTASSEQPRRAQELAAVQVAMFEAMNFVEGKYIPRFLVRQPAPLGASGEVEGIGAAHHALAQLYPEWKATLDAALELFLAAFPDWDATSRARIWGAHLGGNVYALSIPERPSNGAKVPSAGNSKVSRLRPSPGKLGADGDTWNSIASRAIEGRTLQPIERARIYALVSLAASMIYSAADDAKASYGSPIQCVACAVGAAIRVILETEFGSANEPGRAYLIPVRSDADESWSAKVGEELGTKIGLEALTYYRRIK